REYGEPELTVDYHSVIAVGDILVKSTHIDCQGLKSIIRILRLGILIGFGQQPAIYTAQVIEHFLVPPGKISRNPSGPNEVTEDRIIITAVEPEVIAVSAHSGNPYVVHL